MELTRKSLATMYGLLENLRKPCNLRRVYMSPELRAAIPKYIYTNSDLQAEPLDRLMGLPVEEVRMMRIYDLKFEREDGISVTFPVSLPKDEKEAYGTE